MTSSIKSTRQWILHNKPVEHAILSGPNATFGLETKDLPPVQDGQLLLKLLYLSNDPAQRGWIDDSIPKDRLYVDPVETGDVMRSYGIAEVIESKASGFDKGALVVGQWNWTEYLVAPASAAQLLPSQSALSPTHYLGALGGTGLTAYVGLVKVLEAKAGETIVVSGAAGATGSMVVQLAKNVVGCSRVVGIAGLDEKCKWVKSLGADACINYKNPDWKEQLIAATHVL
jgi:NADPH-dependent curcumin reductase CurA